jgi:signal transduction histidine kinase
LNGGDTPFASRTLEVVGDPARSDATSMRTILVAFACWTTLGLIESVNGYVGNIVRGTPRPFAAALMANMPWWYTWFLLTPAVIWIVQRAPLDSRHWKRGLAVHAVAGFVISLVHLGIEGTIFFALKPSGMPGPQTAWAQIELFFANYLMTDLLTYWAVVGSYSAFVYRQRLRVSALRAAQLEAQSAQLALGLAEARMHALRMELNPHFLFNTLNAISGLVRKQEGAAAVEMIARLGTLLRTTLDQELSPVVQVREELALLQQYVEIERVRFGDRLDVRVHVPPDANDALIPTLLLQPLVENAIKHGVAARTGDAHIDIDIERIDDRLRITVQDAGTGISRDGVDQVQERIGLGNTRARLRALYGDNATLDLRNGTAGGACAVLSMPYHTADAGMLPQMTAQHSGNGS